MKYRVSLALVVLAASLSPSLALAEPAPGTLAAAEAAYLDVDFDTTRSACAAALRGGKNDPAETLRLYTLLGIASAALGEDTEARDAFRRVVATDPEARLDKSLSPKLRAPYLEVRGELTARGDLPKLDARLVRRGTRLVFELTDPASIVSSADVAYRTGKSGQVTHWHLEAEREATRPEAIPVTERIEYTVALRDAYGNALVRHGGDGAPVVLEPSSMPRRPAPAPAAAPASPPPPSAPSDAGAYYLTAGLLAGAAVATGGVGVGFHLQREAEAEKWNGAGCERAGTSRGEQCAQVNDKRQTAERLAIGLYAGSGALLLGSVVSLLLAPASPPNHRAAVSLPCAPAAAGLGAECSVSF